VPPASPPPPSASRSQRPLPSLFARQAYRAAALQFHPDKLPPDATEEQKQAAVLKFREVQEAHDTLSRIFGFTKGAGPRAPGPPEPEEEEAAEPEETQT
jgi:curved DNA-binding protein CbpA